MLEQPRSDGAQGSIVNWYGTINKQMAIVPGSAINSTHKYACAQYCPLTGTPSLPPLVFASASGSSASFLRR